MKSPMSMNSKSLQFDTNLYSVETSQLSKEGSSREELETAIRSQIDEATDKAWKEGENERKKTVKIGDYELEGELAFDYQLLSLASGTYFAPSVRYDYQDKLSVLERMQPHNSWKGLEGLQVVQKLSQEDKGVWRVERIDTQSSPESPMPDQPEKLSFCAYFNSKHSVRIKEVKQPLIIASKDGQQKHLVPELVHFWNCVSPLHPKAQQLSFKAQEFLRVTPQQAEDHLSCVISQLSNAKLIKKSASIYEFSPLPQPSMQVSGGNSEVPVVKGVFSYRGLTSKAVQLKNWGVAFTNSDKTSSQEAQRAVYSLKVVSHQYGIRLTNEPGYIPVKSDSLPDWKARLQEDVTTYGPPQVLLILLKNGELHLRDGLLRMVTEELRFPCQIVEEGSLLRSRKLLEFWAGTMMKMQMKIGGVPWQASLRQCQLSKYRVMQGGIHIAKEQEGSWAMSLVGSVTDKMLPCYSFCRRGVREEERLKVYESAVLAWAKNYVIKMHKPPEVIVLYRQPTRNSRAEMKEELERLEAIVKRIGEKTKTTNYFPQVLYVEVEPSRDVALFSREANDKGTVKLVDCPEGYCARVSVEGWGLSFLISNRPVEGQRCMPSWFRVLDPGRVQPEALMHFSYLQCHNCPSDPHFSPVPGCLSSAMALLGLAARSQLSLSFEDPMSLSPYYLQ